MSASSALQALRVPGKVFVDTVGAAGPGTEIGLLRDVEIRRLEGQFDVILEEFGVEIGNSVYLGEVWRLGMALRSDDLTAFATIFPNTTGGGAAVIYPGPNTAGRFRAQDSVRVEFVPRNTAHKGLVFDSAIPRAMAELEIALSKNTERLVLCEFLALRDTATPDGSVTWS